MALKGSTEARVFTPPLGELTPDTSLGFEAADFAENVLGIELRPWQRWLLIRALELDPESGYTDYRFRQVVVLVGRQNGKTVVMSILGLWRLFMDGASEILSTAQNLRVAEDTLRDAFLMAKRCPSLAQFLPVRNERGQSSHYMRTANGSNQLELASVPDYLEDVLDLSGAMPAWYVVATNSGGRSFSADLALMDELREHHSEDVWDAIQPTTAERPRNQIWAFSNAGDRRSVVLRRLRNVARAALRDGTSDQSRIGLFEWSAEPEAAIDDPEAWAAANPSLGYGNRTGRDMLALVQQAIDPDDPEASELGFRTEYLCQWVDDLRADEDSPPISPSQLDSVMTSDLLEVSGSVLAIDAAPDRSACSISAGGRLADGRVWGGLLWHGPLHTDSVVAAVLDACSKIDPAEIVVDPKSPAEVLLHPLADAGIDEESIHAMSWGEVKSATSAFLSGIDDESYCLAESPLLRDGFAVARLREDSEGGVAWKRASGVICQVVATSAAMWAAGRYEPVAVDRRPSAELRAVRRARQRVTDF